MNRAEFEKLAHESFVRRLALSARKGADYADIDVLSNFKRVANICRWLHVEAKDPKGVTLFFIIHKLDRICNLMKNGAPPQNESLQDNLDDLQNYIDLLRAILAEVG